MAHLLRIFPYSVRMLENTGQKNSKYGHFSRCVIYSFFKDSIEDRSSDIGNIAT